MLVISNSGVGTAQNEVHVVKYDAIIHSFTEEREDTRMVVVELIGGSCIDLVGVPGEESHIQLMKDLERACAGGLESYDLRVKNDPLK